MGNKSVQAELLIVEHNADTTISLSNSMPLESSLLLPGDLIQDGPYFHGLKAYVLYIGVAC